ncbi:MAG: ROK family protein [Oscillospiraceae bacterium]|nr:ROK family protein [Oscillospiraceae bacterium]
MYYIGIDLGGTNIAAGIVDENYKIIKKGSTPTLGNRDPKEIIRDMGALCARLVEECGLTFDDIEYAGIAAPGTANAATGMIDFANNLPFLHFPISEVLMSFIPVKKVYIDNDANAAAWAEAIAGAAKNVANSVFITLGTGVGGGVIINGKLYAGFNYAGAELGHMVIEYKGRPCTCGRYGCWETYSSATGLINMTREKMLENKDSVMWDMCENSIDKLSGKTAFAAMKKGDKAASEVVDMYIKYLACGIGNIILLFQPEILCIGGGVCNEGDYLMKPLMAILNNEPAIERRKTQIKIAELGNDAGIIGAAVLGL